MLAKYDGSIPRRVPVPLVFLGSLQSWCLVPPQNFKPAASTSTIGHPSDFAHSGYPPVRRVLIYRLGSLGDTVIALPCFHLIARTFPEARRALLTNIPVHSTAPAAAAVLGSTGLVHEYIKYPVGIRNPWHLARLVLTLRRYRADVLIYLAAPRGAAALTRDLRFFRLCGIRRIFGIPSGDLAENLTDPRTGLLEAEASRLARTLRPLGNALPEEQASWDLLLTSSEKAAAAESTRALAGVPYIVCAPGCKAPANDWEDANWSALFHQLSIRLPGYGLILTGADSDRLRNERLRTFWHGRSLNLCGNSPREAAAMLTGAVLYVGPDSGPMHIAAAVGTPCVSIFSSRLALGKWFPNGSSLPASPHRVLYHRTDCSPCGLDVCIAEGKRCILSITPEMVCDTILDSLQAGAQPSFSTQGLSTST